MFCFPKWPHCGPPPPPGSGESMQLLYFCLISWLQYWFWFSSQWKRNKKIKWPRLKRAGEKLWGREAKSIGGKKKWPWEHVLKREVLHLKKIQGEQRIFLCLNCFYRVQAHLVKFFTHLGKREALFLTMSPPRFVLYCIQTNSNQCFWLLSIHSVLKLITEGFFVVFFLSGYTWENETGFGWLINF